MQHDPLSGLKFHLFRKRLQCFCKPCIILADVRNTFCPPFMNVDTITWFMIYSAAATLEISSLLTSTSLCKIWSAFSNLKKRNKKCQQARHLQLFLLNNTMKTMVCRNEHNQSFFLNFNFQAARPQLTSIVLKFVNNTQHKYNLLLTTMPLVVHHTHNKWIKQNWLLFHINLNRQFFLFITVLQYVLQK